MATLSPSVGDVYSIPVIHHAQITADDTGGTTFKVPFKGRIIAANGTVEAVGGGTVFSDVDLVVKEGSTTIVTLAAVDGSAIVSGGGFNSSLDYAVDAGDVLELEIDVTGGAGTPTANGINVTLWVTRE